MDNIVGLSNRQETDLLLLCKEFFKESGGIRIESYFYAPETGTFACFYIKNIPERIQWFQLCTTALVKRMNETLKNKINLGDFLYDVAETNNIHPVDYLFNHWQNEKRP